MPPCGRGTVPTRVPGGKPEAPEPPEPCPAPAITRPGTEIEPLAPVTYVTPSTRTFTPASAGRVLTCTGATPSVARRGPAAPATPGATLTASIDVTAARVATLRALTG